MDLEVRTNHDDGTTGVVNTLTQQVLAETPLLALQVVTQGLQGTVTGTRNRAATATVIKERVNGFLQHTLFVVDDDLGGTKIKQTLQPVIAVDNASVQVVQVTRRKAPTIQLHHRAQVWGNNGHGL